MNTEQQPSNSLDALPEKLNKLSSAKLSVPLKNLCSTSFFSHYKLNLNKQCPFWAENDLCNEPGYPEEVKQVLKQFSTSNNTLSASYLAQLQAEKRIGSHPDRLENMYFYSSQ
ncbi:hypothetical protein CONCODRAFT_3889 [Conidiobolus coronatus NRRL 28638]|uniref:Uncharacterized protein n=1 Tax=Conidiobolus coronatus (strain ATCC 28846 / CBS 209.66 / NRRL 28638) TaxID=796925 RepID=A0A137PDY5_CONC2|nr:hypothetical protein CONCODRAFT_3889 [Conidiobolus coronatus NRRL 28638]|eukprot:KXN73218.1 hypothetical protein CONCODRAFT_3889 [Conidiobolus coronatus NRRL 28638]